MTHISRIFVDAGKSMKKLTIGLLAHVDAGKTTLTESILFLSGMIRQQGRVDKGSAFLDTEELEKKRGVTIHSKQAIAGLGVDSPLNLSGQDIRLTLIDTPGHADFAGEAERTLSVLDLAVLIVSAPDGVPDDLQKMSRLLDARNIPYIVFVNKTDLTGPGRESISDSLSGSLGTGVMEYRPEDPEALEDIASLSDKTIESFLDTGTLTSSDITSLIYSCRYHPAVFGSAVRNEGTGELLKLITAYAPNIRSKPELSMRIFKILYEDGQKLCFAKITGGRLNVRDTLPDDRLSGEKITQIRLYSGSRYKTQPVAEQGDVVALAGLDSAFSGMGIGEEPDEGRLQAHPVLKYRMLLPDDVPARTFIPKMRELAAEDPLLELEISDGGEAISISVMGDFQLEILSLTIEERFGVRVSFDSGRIIYKETIKAPAVGYGHFEPLRHYAEIHILMEPLPPGSGIEIRSALSVDELDINWQKTVMSALRQDLPPGILTGSALTDMRFTLISGRSHTKHSESRDFFEAARRAVRQGLMKAGCLLLEPCHDFVITLPTECLGRAINDISLMNGVSSLAGQDGDTAILQGTAPAKGIINYQRELTGYTSGRGSLELSFSGYRECPGAEAEAVISEICYDPGTDAGNPSGSIFTSHGAGRCIPWNECEAMMHAPDRAKEYTGL